MTTTRTRAPSEIKWLANELAATKGELERIDEELARLQARRERLKAVFASLSAVSALAAAPGLAHAVPAVRAHPARGGRGSVTNFIRATLQGAYPNPVDTRRMTQLAVEHFGLTFATSQQRNRFRRATVSDTLQRLVAAGQVERLHDFKTMPNLPGLWRWKVDGLSAEDLMGEGVDHVARKDGNVEGDPWR